MKTIKIYFSLVTAKLRNPRCEVEWIEFENGTPVKKITL